MSAAVGGVAGDDSLAGRTPGGEPVGDPHVRQYLAAGGRCVPQFGQPVAGAARS